MGYRMSWRGVVENEVVYRGEQGTSSVYVHVVGVCRGQHEFLRGVV